MRDGASGGRRAADAVAAKLRRLIVTGQIGRGGFLEPTNVLLARFGVSRPTLREAFRMLENEQLLSVRQGSRSGVRVLHPGTDAATRIGAQTLQDKGAVIGELYEAALGLEPFAARLLAERGDPADAAALRDRLAELERSVAGADVRAHGVALARFHRLVVDRTGNRAMMLMADLIAGAIERHQGADGAPPRTASDPSMRQDFRTLGTRSIARLIALIEAGDASGAEAHWRRHVRNANAFWLRGIDPATPIDVLR